ERAGDCFGDAHCLGNDENYHRAISGCSICGDPTIEDQHSRESRRHYSHRRQCRSRCVALESVEAAVLAASIDVVQATRVPPHRKPGNFLRNQGTIGRTKTEKCTRRRSILGMKGLGLIIAGFILVFGTVVSRGVNVDRISAETGVPVATLQAERASTGLGWGGLEKAHL